MKLILMFSLLSMSSAFAGELAFGPYIKMQEALASDDMKTALEAHKVICTKDLTSLKDSYKDCTKTFSGIDDLRSSFKNLSLVYLEHGNKKELKDLSTATCPMAKAKWVQKNTSLRNPYYGKSMLECGEKI